MGEVEWGTCGRLARELKPAGQWRQELAEAIRSASGAEYVTVVTCPPWQYLAAQAATAPLTLQSLTEQLFVEALPRIERTNEGMALTPKLGEEVYAPLERVADRALAQEIQLRLLKPRKIEGLLHSFLLAEPGPIGWISVGTKAPSAEALAAFGGPLTEVVRAAAVTLRRAIGLAEGCGLVLKPHAHEVLDVLTERERQIAQLVMLGLSDVNVAHRLKLSEATVGSHLKKIFRRLGVHSRVELAAIVSGSGSRPTVVSPPSRSRAPR